MTLRLIISAVIIWYTKTYAPRRDVLSSRRLLPITLRMDVDTVTTQREMLAWNKHAERRNNKSQRKGKVFKHKAKRVKFLKAISTTNRSEMLVCL
ncbi:hypothetical protein ElyMa_005882300 [Elysia marginata]|uniref:Secreted protein n=1 Tax=Elysia marginata TaxID=1093978 RepID=A0AAV4G2I9_9GAST|nr:hypothetical protein ElyMa_005882300 [Elysia marginata]